MKNNFTIYPAIDLKDGKCVRLFKGDMNQATIFANSPQAQAKQFEEAGFKWLHLVDLDGACAGKSLNTQSIDAILQHITIPVQLGGGIRTLENIEYWLNRGIKRVILGTIAAKNPELVKQACKQFPNQIMVGIDAKNGMVAVDGWVNLDTITATDLALHFEDAGVAGLIYTDIERDGAMQGANIAQTKMLAERISTPVIISGGVNGIEDLRNIQAESSISGAIIGRAFYEGAISYDDALK